MPRDPETLAHLEWLGYVQPVGLVVSIPALLAAQAHVNRNIAPDHARLLASLPRDSDEEPIAEIRDFAEFARHVLGWRETDLERVAPGDTRYAVLEAHLPEYQETLRPSYVIREHERKDGDHPWMMLIQSLPAGTLLDKLNATEETHWQATPHAKFERLLRETKVPIGLLASPSHLRLVYAPRGETSGHMTFSVAEMAQVAGRPIFAALHMLLSEERLFSLGEKQRLPAILADSRKYQNHVSNELAQQVLAALYELLRGFQAADDATRGELLREVLARDPNHVYGGLLTVLMRLVFVLYAEDRDLLSSDSVYANHYSVTGLFERLRADAGRYPDTMDQRFGAWAQLLTLFRLIYDGGSHGGMKIPPRRGYLFDPDRYCFLEGRSQQAGGQQQPDTYVPRISDGVIFRLLHNLLILDGERLSYRTLDVEQIGGVYETIMGFNIEVAQGRSIAIKPNKSHGAPATINLEALLQTSPADRAKWLKANADQSLTGQAATSVKQADTVDDLLAALDRKIAKNVTPNVVAIGSMVFQPSDERRKSGSHYTPRSLTEPLVRTTLKPILEQLGERPKPEQILALNVCDPAMGSGAFLVEACRQLGDELVKSWHVHNRVPKLPPDEDELLHARRLIAQQCLYGVDKNPMAVDLSKLSLWLATLAKDHAFTFLDHSLRTGDSLLGLSRKQIAAFHWLPQSKRSKDSPWFGDPIAAKMQTVTEYRQRILAARDDKPYEQLRQELDVADEALALARLTGDLVVAAYFSADKDRERIAKLDTLARQLVKYIGPQGKAEDRQPLTDAKNSLCANKQPIHPFHWQMEFPEVFNADNSTEGDGTGGFDAIVGNPPFLGGLRISNMLGMDYFGFLADMYPGAGHLCDLVAYFFRRSFSLIRHGGTLGLIATNSIAQGDTRTGGLAFICGNGGTIFAAERRLKWPGQAAVIVSVVHILRGRTISPCLLDGLPVERVSAYLFAKGGDDNPARLKSMNPLFSQGTNIRSPGFLVGDDGEPTTSTEMQKILDDHPECRSRVMPYLGGEEINSSPAHTPKRQVIFLSDIREEADLDRWAPLAEIVRRKVKPERDALGDNPNNIRLRREWWAYHADRRDFYEQIRQMGVVLVASQVSNHLALAVQPPDRIFGNTLNLFLVPVFSGFSVMQSRVHEVWVRTFASSMKDDMRYTPSDCFETFPFPRGVLALALDHDASMDGSHTVKLEKSGREYYEFRAALMVRNNEGLTKTYNRFHDPDERSADVLRVRELHAAMDRAVLESYGWHDLAEHVTCEFLLDYEDDDDAEESASSRRRRKPWRYRWPEEFRDEVLARLLDLNQKRAEEERFAGEAAEAAATGKGNKSRGASKTKKSGPQNLGLFDNSPAGGDA